jgi:hypothetical protein
VKVTALSQRGHGQLLSPYRHVVLPVVGAPKGEGLPGCSPPPPKRNFKKHRFCRQDGINVLRDSRFSLNQPLSSTLEY